MFFYFLKIIFDISTSKRSRKYKPYSILTKKKKLKFYKKLFGPQRQTASKEMRDFPELERKKYLSSFIIEILLVTHSFIQRVGSITPTDNQNPKKSPASYLD